MARPIMDNLFLLIVSRANIFLHIGLDFLWTVVFSRFDIDCFEIWEISFEFRYQVIHCDVVMTYHKV